MGLKPGMLEALIRVRNTIMLLPTARVSRTFPMLLMASALALSFTSCAANTDETEYLDAQQAEARSLELLEELSTQVPTDAVDTNDPLPGPGDESHSPKICDGVDGGNAGTPMYYPGEMSIRLIEEADTSAVAENMIEQLQADHAWQTSQNLAVTEEDDNAHRGLVTNDGYMIAIWAQEHTDGHDALNIAVWSPCYSADDGQGADIGD